MVSKGCNKVIIDLDVQFSPEIILKISIRTRISSPFNFEITRMFETKLESAYSISSVTIINWPINSQEYTLIRVL